MRLLGLISLFSFPNIGFSKVDFFQRSFTETTFDHIVNITATSQNFFNDIGHWPNSIEHLVGMNYLESALHGYSLLNQNGSLDIAIENSAKNNINLEKYFLKYTIDKKMGKILVPVSRDDKINDKYRAFGVCSNLYCLSY
ncbi:hypothetical protein CVFO_1346 [Isorropodon fossajaponicum endosymbiont JTNG4]|nr:hypothetical protein CVFO_1346 [Isorropodon fossajaponicum endosymbiont JTNG4]